MDTLPLDREVIVLLAADEPEVRTMLEKLLKQGGYELVVAADGQDALHKADDHKGRIDLLVASLQMPGMTGTDLARELRRARPEAQGDVDVVLPPGFARPGHGVAIHTKTVLIQSAARKAHPAFEKAAVAPHGPWSRLTERNGRSTQRLLNPSRKIWSDQATAFR